MPAGSAQNAVFRRSSSDRRQGFKTPSKTLQGAKRGPSQHIETKSIPDLRAGLQKAAGGGRSGRRKAKSSRTMHPSSQKRHPRRRKHERNQQLVDFAPCREQRFQLGRSESLSEATPQGVIRTARRAGGRQTRRPGRGPSPRRLSGRRGQYRRHKRDQRRR